MAKEMNMEALQANLKLLDKKGQLAFEQAKAAGTLTPQQEKASALLSDTLFVDKLLAADSAEQVQALFLENGVEVSLEEVNAFGAFVVQVSKKLIENGGELTEEDLEAVAGGLDGMSEGEEIAVGVATSLGLTGGAAGGLYAGAAIGSAILPGAGSVVGGIVGAGIGFVAGAGAGGAVAFVQSVGVGAVAEKLSKWILSWF